VLTRIRTYVIIPNKSTAISVKKRFCVVLFPAKIYRPATHPIHFAAVLPRQNLSPVLRGRYFSFWEQHLENFMSRPNVIPAFQPTPLHKQGQELRSEQTAINIHEQRNSLLIFAS
jgi:hypothetical protein